MADNYTTSAGDGDGKSYRSFQDTNTIDWPACVVCYATTVGDPNVLVPVTTSAQLPVSVYANTAKDASGTDYVPLVDSDGHLQVDVLSCASHAVTNAGTFAVQVDGDALTALQVIDDWDESDRAKVNPIVGQAGIAAGSGAVGATVPRVTLASDDPAVALLTTMDADTSTLAGAVSGTEMQVDVLTIAAGDNNIGNVDIVTHPADTFVAEDGALGKGVLVQGDDGTDRKNVLVDTDGHLQVDVLSAPSTAVTGTFWQETQPVSAAALPLPSGAATESTLSTLNGKVTACNTGAVVIASGSCAVTGTFWQETQPVSLASVPSHAVTNAGTFATQVDGDALTALQLIDDTVAVLGTATYTETTTKGNIVGAVRNDDLATLADTDNEIAPVQVNSSGALYTENSPQVDYLFDGSAKCTIKRWQSAEAASGTNTLMTAVATKKFRVLSLAVFATSDTEVSFYFEDADNAACLGTSSSKFIVDISGSSGPAGFVMGYNPAGWFETPTANKDFEINLSAAVSVNVVIQYIEVA